MIPDSEHRILNSDRLKETMTTTAIGDTTPINSTHVAADTPGHAAAAKRPHHPDPGAGRDYRR